MNYKTILIIFFLFLVSFSYSQILINLDANLEQDLILDSDGVINQSFLATDVTSVLTLDLFNKMIKDLTGIAAFPDLVKLNCDGNELIELDLSEQANLFNLDCDNNFLINLNLKNGNSMKIN